MFSRCTSCGQLPSRPVEGGIRVVCRCGKTSVEFRQPVDIEALKRLALGALERARLRVHAVPTAHGEGFTLAVEREPQPRAGLEESDARRYADAINGEAELARAMVQLLAELEDLRRQALHDARASQAPRHGSGTMPRVPFAGLDDDDDGQEDVG